MEQLVRQSETGDAAGTMAACKTHAPMCSWEEKGNVQLDAIIEVALEEAAKNGWLLKLPTAKCGGSKNAWRTRPPRPLKPSSKRRTEPAEKKARRKKR